jgi:endonuclease YncB( thermonuclease family)
MPRDIHHNAKVIITLRGVAALLWLALTSPFAALASDDFADLAAGPTVHVAQVGYAASFDLTDGSRVRLVGIRAPKPDTPPFRAEAEPLGDAAKAFVEAFVAGHALTLHTDANPKDRYGRHLAHVVRDDGVWLQQALLEAGLARVYTFPDNRKRVAQLLAFEAAARQAGRGIWALPHYAVERAETIQPGGFALVEGKVLSQSRGDGPTYVNFGKTWKTDFTIRIQPGDRKRFGSHVRDLLGKTVRVRGWVFEKDGPMIDVTHPEQIEVLD